ncbi:hypothetical protein FDG2_3356 [Candidatus Protofrankia californiensis]|uniref:Uncharacterized protein n=1 Tax=Candidatus Protofrankia californiensis TaxID=1839754 RepID=A0A1C3NZI1_9ACTN|nr:hypothetical protein FDG2_3356 [Candidatus Protofrankia californiensis]
MAPHRPDDAVHYPAAGYKFLLRPPARFTEFVDGDVSGVELFDFLLARDAAVKLSTSRSFNPEHTGWMRMIVMQQPESVAEFFDRLAAIGVHYDMRPSPELADEFRTVIAQCDLWNL